eukprot:SAG22_NODE_1428_length_4445_cov_1.417663_3_plen_41_part_00
MQAAGRQAAVSPIDSQILIRTLSATLGGGPGLGPVLVRSF